LFSRAAYHPTNNLPSDYGQGEYRMTELDNYRAEKDKYFAEDEQSPLTPQQRHDFKGLNYFPENPALQFDVAVDQFPDQKTVQIQTTTGDVQTYRRWGHFHFTVEGEPAELTIFTGESGYFLPFVDSLAGRETYPAGRYLEPEPLGGRRFRIDFNLAYNPYCAYNEAWSCPMTPFENRLKVPIRAGERIFHPA
jgi:uncharacterized protein (DUF1684 family)